MTLMTRSKSSPHSERIEMYLLAQSLGKVAANAGGLCKLILPRALPADFRLEVANSARMNGIEAIVVGDRREKGEVTPQEAISYRTPEHEGVGSVLLVTTEGFARDLKSLETFRDLLVQGLPGGVVSGQNSILSLDAISDELAALAISTSRINFPIETLAELIKTVTTYLGEAYQSSGNDAGAWTTSFWQHLDFFSKALPTTLAGAVSGHPNSLAYATYLAAGLPRPTQPIGFSPKNNAARFAAVIERRWADGEVLERTLLDIEGYDDLSPHPIRRVSWDSLSSSKAIYNHPILAVTQHGRDSAAYEPWLAAWSGTSEEAFFHELQEKEVELRISCSDESGTEQEVPFLDVGGNSLFVLPQPPNKLEEDGILKIASILIRAKTEDSTDGKSLSVDPQIVPKSAAIVTDCSSTVTSSGFEIRLKLERKITRPSNWIEKPITIVLVPKSVDSTALLTDKLKIEIVIPNPVRPTVFALERRNSSAGAKIKNYANTQVIPDETARRLVCDNNDDEALEIALQSNRSLVEVVCVGEHDGLRWLGADEILASATGGKLSNFKQYEIRSMPEESVLLTNNLEVRLTTPFSESGQITPIVAAITGDPIVPADGEVLSEIKSDPRYKLEKFLAHHCIQNSVEAEFQKCLGSVLLGTGTNSLPNDLHWRDDIGAFSDLSGGVNAHFPSLDSPALEKFWTAFNQLELLNCAGQTESSALPSALDLTKIPRTRVDSYLNAFQGLLDHIDPSKRGSAWSAYPFSALLFDSGRGAFRGALLSPLHPIRFAWAWSAQRSAEAVANDSTFKSTSRSFLRFIDGDSLPLVGPSLEDSENYLAMSLSAGPEEFFSSWSMLAPEEFHSHYSERSLRLLNLDLPLGAPSGLDRGGVSSAIKDYMRVFPFTPQLRIGLSSRTLRQRFAETDDAIVAASTELLAKSGAELPGGVRIRDSKNRLGSPPNATQVLRRFAKDNDAKSIGQPSPAFEWTVNEDSGAVDLKFLEDSPVSLRLRSNDSTQPGSTGPSLPTNRFKSWQENHGGSSRSIVLTKLSDGAFDGLTYFRAAMNSFESLAVSGRSTAVEGQLLLGDELLGLDARWTITGNRHLNPSTLSRQLSGEGQGKLTLWEWRPAFLARSQQKGVRTSIASNQPYTVLAKTTDAFTRDIESTLIKCGVDVIHLPAKSVLATLGMRGVGLASLLTMGHSQSMGAVGFFMAFKALEHWEASASSDEIRCVLPMDAVYPLIDALAIGSKEVDDQKRADLLLLKARVTKNDRVVALLHPVEIKARSKTGSRFPASTDAVLKDPTHQLASTEKAIEALGENLTKAAGKLGLVNSAIATLVEATLALRPSNMPRSPSIEIRVLEAAANGTLQITGTPGTLVWFQASALGLGGAPFERRPGTANHAGHFLSDFASAANCIAGDDYSTYVSETVESAMPSWDSTTTSKPLVQNKVSGLPPAPVSEPEPESNDTAPETVPNETSRAVDVEPESASSAENETNGAPQSGIEILVGHEFLGQTEKSIILRPSETSLSQLNIGVVGDLGTGKTQFLKSLIYQLSASANQNRGREPKAFMFDYKNDYSKGEFPESINAKVLDPTRTLPLNFFALGPSHTHVDRVRRANFFSDILRRISGIGQVQRQVLYESVMQSYANCPEGLSPLLDDVFDIYRSKTDGKADSVVSVLSLMTDLRIFERNANNVLSFNEIFVGNTVLNLSSLGGAGQDIVDIIATMFLDHLYHDYMKNVPKEPFVVGDDGVSRRVVDSFVLIDEAHHAMGRGFEVLMKLMLEGREFGMGVILSSQFLSHFQLGSHDWAEALSTWVVHNVRNAKPKDFERIGFRGNTQSMSTQVSTLEPHWAYYRCANGQTEGVMLRGQPYFSLPRSD